VFYNTANEKLDSGNFELAITFYDEAIKLDPGNLEMLLSRATAYRLCSPPKLDAALQDTAKAVQINPQSWNAWHARGEALLANGDLGDAEEALQNALELAPRMNQLQAQSSLALIREKKAAAKFALQHRLPSTVPDAEAAQTTSPQLPGASTMPRRADNASHIGQAPSSLAAFTAEGLEALTENVPSDPPPSYSAEPTPQRNTVTAADITDRLQSLAIALAPRNKGRIRVQAYTSTDSVDAVRLIYVGMTNLELTVRELPVPTYLHESHSE
jgi:tetratricopeptide (TPR) repeat protein